MDEHMKKCLKWILMVSASPIAFFVCLLMALYSLFRFLCKAALLFTIVAINTPFAVMYNVSILVFEYNLARFQDSRVDSWNWSDPRASVGIEVQLIVSDFFKVVAGELLLVLSTGVITFYTVPRQVFYVSMAVGVTAISLKWLNTDSLSKTALTCLCDGYGLSPLMFLFSFVGLYDIGCHPVAKCSFAATRAFLFVKRGPSPSNTRIFDRETDPAEGGGTNKQGHNKFKGPYPFNGATINPQKMFIEFLKWNAFERGLFQLSPRIDFMSRKHGKYILKSLMVLKLFGVNLCEYPVERLELPEDYSKVHELYNFLVTLSLEDGFVTDKMRGRYEHSLTLLEIVDGVEESVGYRIMQPMDAKFVVALFTKKLELVEA